MNQGVLNKRIPTIIALLLLFTGIGVLFFFLNKGQLPIATKPPQEKPEDVQISNIYDDQFTVSWFTDEKTTGFIKYGETTSLETVVKDDRDQISGETDNFNAHYVTLKNLEASKTYYFKVGSGSNLFDDNGQNYSVTTGPTLGSPGQAQIINGKVLSSDKTPASGAVVLLSSSNISSLSSLTDKDGRWAIFMNKARVSDLSSYTVFDPQATIIKINADNGKQNTSAVTITKNAFPVPDIILGHEAYDFREGYVAQKTPTQAEAAPQSQEPDPQYGLGQIDRPDVPPVIIEFTINNPAEDDEEIYSQKPQFRGKGPNSKVLTIMIESPSTHRGTTTVNEDGNWTYTPTENLSLGKHTIFVSYVKNDGSTRTISRSFLVINTEVGEQPAVFVATPSASASPSPSPSPQPSPTLTPSPSARVTIPATDSGVPTTGTVLPTFLVFIIGVFLTTSSLITITIVDKKQKTRS